MRESTTLHRWAGWVPLGGLTLILPWALSCGSTQGGSLPSPDFAVDSLLVEGGRDLRSPFAAAFCSLLPHTGEDWAPCENFLYLQQTPGVDVPEADLSRYRLLVLSGILSECAEPEHRLLSRATDHLSHLGIEVEYLSLPALGSAEYNAEIVAGYLSVAPPDGRDYIVVGYSKGAVDALVALAGQPEIADRVAALLTIAGAMGGSRLASAGETLLLPLMRALDIDGCTEADGLAFESLSPEVRWAFIDSLAGPPVPTYAIAGVMRARDVSVVLSPLAAAMPGQSWNDSQVALEDAILPGAHLLAIARADHLALGMPFDGAEGIPQSLVNRNRFPRMAMLEAALLLIAADLGR